MACGVRRCVAVATMADGPGRVGALRAVALVAVGLLGGCRRDTPAAKKPKPKLGITVHRAGSAPRVRLRYRFRPGQTLTYHLTSTQQVTGLPRAARPFELEISLGARRVRRGWARVRWRVERVIRGQPELGGHELWMDLSSRGEAVPRRRRGPAVQAGLRQAVSQLFLTWPKEAVGPGAEWTQRRSLNLTPASMGGIRVSAQGRYHFERVARCGQSRCAYLSVRVALRLSHRAGSVMVRGEGAGTGRVVFDLPRGRLVESRTQARIGLAASLDPSRLEHLTLQQTMELRR